MGDVVGGITIRCLVAIVTLRMRPLEAAEARQLPPTYQVRQLRPTSICARSVVGLEANSLFASISAVNGRNQRTLVNRCAKLRSAFYIRRRGMFGLEDELNEKIDDLTKEIAALKAEVASLRIAQHPQPAMCLGCEYWRMPSGGHCMRGEGTEFCFKVGTHAGVR